jgi:hypothetical protein
MRPPPLPCACDGAVGVPPVGEPVAGEVALGAVPWAEVGGLAGGVAGGLAVWADPEALGAAPVAGRLEVWAVGDGVPVVPAEPDAPAPVEAPGACVAVGGGDAVAPLAGEDGLEDGEVWAKARGAPRISAASAAPYRKRVGFTTILRSRLPMATDRASHGSA